MNDFLTITALIGTTLIVVRSTVFAQIQKLWPALFRCSQCTGVWIGAMAGGSGAVPTGHGHVLDAIIVGSATSFLSMSADAVLLYLLGNPDVEKEG
jgi:hypothetical protein